MPETEKPKVEPEEIYIFVADVAKHLKDEKTGRPWRTQRMRRWMCRAGACKKVNGRWVTTPSLLREYFEDVWIKIQSELPDEF